MNINVANYKLFVYCLFTPEGRYIIVVCLLATLRKNFCRDLHEVFRESWHWASEQMIKFCWRSTAEATGARGA